MIHKFHEGNQRATGIIFDLYFSSIDRDAWITIGIVIYGLEIFKEIKIR